MSTQREEAIVELGLDSNSFQRGFESVAHNFRSGLNQLANQWMGAFTVGGIIAGFSKVIEKFHQIQVQADNLNVGTDFLQGLQHIAKSEVVGGVQKIERALMDLNVKLAEAKSGNKEAIATFEKWGITAADIASLDTEGMFLRVADATREASHRGLGAAAAFELIGKSGKNMAHVLAQGSVEIQKEIDGAVKVSEKRIRELADTKQRLEDIPEQLYTATADFITFFFNEIPQTLGKLSTGLRSSANAGEEYVRLREASAKEAEKERLAQEAIRHEIEEQIIALQKFDDARNTSRQEGQLAVDKARAQVGDDNDKYIAAFNERVHLQALYAAAEADTGEKLKLQAQIIIATAHEKEAFNKLDSRDNKEAIADLIEQRKIIAEELALRAKYLPNLNELARGGAFGKDARQVKSLDLKIKREFESGNITGANQDIARREKLYDKIFDALNGRTPIPVHPKLKP